MKRLEGISLKGMSLLDVSSQTKHQTHDKGYGKRTLKGDLSARLD